MKLTPVHLVFQNESFHDHEQILFCSDADSGLKAIIAVHSTALGPAMGGTRMWAYASEAAALQDVLRLSHGMTYKNALAGIDFGGGKAVILGDSRKDKTPERLRAFAAHVDRLSGTYITAEDVGISVADVEEMRRVTPHVRGIAEGGAGDPSPNTAFGVYKGVEAAVRHRLEAKDLSGVRVAVQGLGNVGMSLCELLHEAGADLIVADINEAKVGEAMDRFNAGQVAADMTHAADADVFAPCALGAGLNETTIPEIKARAVAGAANNQLATAEDGERLRQRNILYAPDYAINAGGVISIAHEGPQFDFALMRRDVARIGETLARIFKRADDEGRPTSVVADLMAEERLAATRTSLKRH